jgi:hypothetical protein
LHIKKLQQLLNWPDVEAPEKILTAINCQTPKMFSKDLLLPCRNVKPNKEIKLPLQFTHKYAQVNLPLHL